MDIKLIKPFQTLDKYAANAWRRTIPQLEAWMRKDLINFLINGGNGIGGISQTEFYKWIISPDGLSQLGIEKSEPPKLLEAYKRAFSIKKGKRFVELLFGDVAKLKMMTPHPASGTGNLHIASWLEWIVDDVTVGRGFVERSRIPKRVQKNIRLKPPIGGLMLPRNALGSTGFWRFPERIKHYEEDWLQHNIAAIQTVLGEKMLELFVKELLS